MGVLERQIRQDVILDAAAKVFFSVGFGSAKMSDVAKKAKLSKGLVYHYYDSKENLYMAVVYNACKLNVQFFNQALQRKQDGSALDKILFFIESYFEFSKQYPFFQEAISTFLSVMNPSKKQVSGVDLSKKFMESPYFTKIVGLQTQPLSILLQLFEEGKKDGSIKTKLSPIYLYMTIWSAMIGFEKLSIKQNTTLNENEFYSFFGLNNQQWESTILDIARTVLVTEGNELDKK
jgi:AcrR family transcriptional regulator